MGLSVSINGEPLTCSKVSSFDCACSNDPGGITGTSASAASIDGPDEVAYLNGRYRLGEVLGSGAQAKVYECFDKQSGKALAIKVFDHAEKKAVNAFKREVAMMEVCGDAKHLVRFLDTFTDPLCAYVVMDKYTCHLQMALKMLRSTQDPEAPPEAVSEKVVRNLVQQAFGGILHLHRRRIVHRDVKAQNFLVDRLNLEDPEAVVVLSDFGLATELKPGRKLAKLAGTRQYWPPEMYDKKYGHPVDIFALGVLTFLVVTGTYPFLSEEETRRRDVFASGSLLPSIATPGALNFLTMTMEKIPSRRATAAELEDNDWLFGTGGGDCSERQQVPFDFTESTTATTEDVSCSTALSTPAARSGSCRSSRLAGSSTAQKHHRHCEHMRRPDFCITPSKDTRRLRDMEAATRGMELLTETGKCVCGEDEESECN